MAINELALSQPVLFMAVASLLITIFITLIYKKVTDQSEMKRLRDELKSMQKEIKEKKDQPEKMMEIQKGLAAKNLEYMKHSFKPMLYTFFPVILVFYWLRGIFEETGTLLTLPIFGWNLNWLWTYIVFSLVFSLIVRKVMKVH